MNHYVVGGQFYNSNELYHHGVKGMKWGVRKSISKVSQTSRRMGRAVSAANLEARRRQMERSIARAKTMQKRTNRDYKAQIKRYKTKMKRLDSLRDTKISDLSEADIDRGRAVYKTMRNVSMSVAVAAASTAAGGISASAAIVTKLVGAGVTAALNDPRLDD